MKLIAVHTCPLWEEEDGSRVVGFEPYDEDDPDAHPPIVGWVNVAELELDGETHLLLV